MCFRTQSQWNILKFMPYHYCSVSTTTQHIRRDSTLSQRPRQDASALLRALQIPNFSYYFSGNPAENLASSWGVLERGEGSLELVLLQDMGRRRVGTRPPALESPAAGIAITSSRLSKELLVELVARSREALCCAECWCPGTHFRSPGSSLGWLPC